MAIMKIVQVLILAILHTCGLSYSLNLQKYYIERPIILITISTVLFYSLCVDLARDQLQNFGYYPITNSIFLATFTACCIICKFQRVKFWWPLVQLSALMVYMLHQQSSLRQILYCQLQSESAYKSIGFIGLAMVSCLAVHAGWGFMINIMLRNQSKLVYKEVPMNEQVGEQIRDQPQNANEQITQENMPLVNETKQDTVQNILQKIMSEQKEFPEILKLFIIGLPLLFSILSIIGEFLIDEYEHQHGHTHTHVYFTKSKLYFKDVTSQNSIMLCLAVLRIAASAIVFQCVFALWSGCFNSPDPVVMKHRFSAAAVGLTIAIGRLLAQRY